MSLYINPVLSDLDYGFARVGGPGLANCMFIVARAAILAKKLDAKLLRPTWERVGVGQWFRHERDKRFYAGLFKKDWLFGGLGKIALLMVKRHVEEDAVKGVLDGVVMVRGLKGYFADLWSDVDFVREYFDQNICPEAISDVPQSLSNTVAVHVRLGDYPRHLRTDIRWYVRTIHSVRRHIGNRRKVVFEVFSDGSDVELAPLLTMPGVVRSYYGNALADIVAISKCRLLIGSDSTFSGWGAFLGNVPCVFAHLHYGKILPENALMLISDNSEEIGMWMQNRENAHAGLN